MAAVGTVLAVVAALSACDSKKAASEERISKAEERISESCEGLLPANHLLPMLPDQPSVAVREYGTMLQPGSESRALLDCSLAWRADTQAAPYRPVKLRAEAVLGQDAAAFPDLDELMASELDEQEKAFGPLPPDAHGMVSLDDDKLVATLTVGCPKGLSGRVRTSRDLLVTLKLPATDPDAYKPSGRERRAAARTAVKTADWVTRRQHCKTPPLADYSAPDSQDKGPGLCSWLDAKALHLTDNTWAAQGGEHYSERIGYCAAIPDDDEYREERPPALQSVTTKSWSGTYTDGVYEEFQDRGKTPGWAGRAKFPRPSTVEIPEPDSELALWAHSTCDAGPAYHRAAVALDTQDSAVLQKRERKQLSEDVRGVLERYLKAPAGWPRRSHCHDTEVLGEAPDWQEDDRR
ncbi:hypothetical protein [Streptomyces sp. NPDC007083]|uniref:hypothetical protein n=1 Tax=Streptomyces sp. NPDC007083 TaxID=3156913 RepID=UPI0034003B62